MAGNFRLFMGKYHRTNHRTKWDSLLFYCQLEMQGTVCRSISQEMDGNGRSTIRSGWKILGEKDDLQSPKLRRQRHISHPWGTGNTQRYSQSISYPIFPENQSTLLETHQVKIIIGQHQVVHKLQIISTLKIHRINGWVAIFTARVLDEHVFCELVQKNRSM